MALASGFIAIFARRSARELLGELAQAGCAEAIRIVFAQVGARTRRKGDAYTLAVDIVCANESGTAARTSLIHLIIYLLVSIDPINLRRQVYLSIRSY